MIVLVGVYEPPLSLSNLLISLYVILLFSVIYRLKRLSGNDSAIMIEMRQEIRHLHKEKDSLAMR